MKLAMIAAIAAVTIAAPSTAQTYVQGHVTQNGTYVAPHYRSAPDSNPYNNYSTQGNVNPYTGQAGTVNPYAYPSRRAPTYQNGYQAGSSRPRRY